MLETPAATTSNDTEILEQLNEQYMRGLRGSDVAWFESHLAPDFMNRGPDGILASRQAFLGLVAQPFALRDFRAVDVTVRLFGDVSVIHGRTVYVKPGGEPGQGRYVDIWQRRGGRWLCIAADVVRG